MEDVRQMLREVLQEELSPIKVQLSEQSEQILALTGRFDTLEGRFDILEGRFDSLEITVNSHSLQLTEIQQTLDRIEHGQNEDVIGLLKQIEQKGSKRIDRHEHRIDLLNERLLVVEADLRMAAAST